MCIRDSHIPGLRARGDSTNVADQILRGGCLTLPYTGSSLHLMLQRSAGDTRGPVGVVRRDRFPSTIVNTSVTFRQSPYVGRMSCVTSTSRNPFSLITSRTTSLKRHSVGVSRGHPSRRLAPFSRSRFWSFSHPDRDKSSCLLYTSDACRRA